MLLLFDIDATLLVTHGTGIRAMVDAGRELFGPHFHADGLEFSGRLDTLIARDMFRVSSVQGDDETYRRFRDRYAHHLQRHLALPDSPARSLPGVIPLLDALALQPIAALGLLTGNFAETGSAKLRACGIDTARFSITVWGDDSPAEPPSRDSLPPVGIRRYQQRFGRPVAPSATTIIGDTPHDVRCAKVNGCRALGVATGKFSIAELQSAGADLAVPDLTDTPKLVDWLLTSS